MLAMRFKEMYFHTLAIACGVSFLSSVAFGGDISFLSLKNVSNLAVYADEKPEAKANLIAVTGGRGLRDPIMTVNFLGRAKDDLVKADINYYMFPNKDSKEIATPEVRSSKDRMERLGNLIKEIKSRNSLPIYIAGFSRGSIEASLASKQFDIDGVIIMSGMYNNAGVKKMKLLNSHLTQNILKTTDKRLLIIHHMEDKCRSTPPYKAERFYYDVVAADKRMIRLLGGDSTGKACGPLNYHGFEGWETDLARNVTEWMLKK